MNKINYKVQGVRGGNPSYRENVGYVATFVDGLTIVADAFEGYGDTYKRREENLITISNNDGKTLFSGTSKQLIDTLNSLNS